MDIILLGAPGAGKGTQAKYLEEHTGMVHVASGDLFRAALRQGTELGMGTELEFVIMVIAVSCVKLLSAHNSTQHTSRKHKV
jgi:Adenylate kinase (EC 2.7.4.3)